MRACQPRRSLSGGNTFLRLNWKNGGERTFEPLSSNIFAFLRDSSLERGGGCHEKKEKRKGKIKREREKR
jgi:hypothetical protein